MAAVCGVCRVMAVFWEAIPLGVTKAYITRWVWILNICIYVWMYIHLQTNRFPPSLLCTNQYIYISTSTNMQTHSKQNHRLVGSLAFDGASALVRLAVVDGKC